MAAIPSVHDGTPIYKAAKVHGVPRSTLHDRISGKVKHWTNPGPKPYLSKAEVTELSGFLVDIAKTSEKVGQRSGKGRFQINVCKQEEKTRENSSTTSSSTAINDPFKSAAVCHPD